VHVYKINARLTDADHDGGVYLPCFVLGCVALYVKISPEVALVNFRKVLAGKRLENLPKCGSPGGSSEAVQSRFLMNIKSSLAAYLHVWNDDVGTAEGGEAEFCLLIGGLYGVLSDWNLESVRAIAQVLDTH